MVPSQKHFSKPLQNGPSSGNYRGCLTGESLGLMTLLRGYESESVPMSSDKEKATAASNKTRNDLKRSDQESDWLQLGIGGCHRISRKRTDQPQPELLSPLGGGLLELPPRRSGCGEPPRKPGLDVTSDMFLRNPSLVFPFHHHDGHQEMNWSFRPPSSAGLSFSSLSSLLPYQFPGGGGGGDRGVGTSSPDFRIILPPPRRPQAGVWFALRALQNQENHLHLPQIPKCYLRIKDGKMTVRLVIKYLVDKLKLHSESEIEITCKGQHLQPFLTLQHVRDDIWRNSTSTRVLNHHDGDDDDSDLVTLLLPNSSTKDHIMVLHYARVDATIRSVST